MNEKPNQKYDVYISYRRDGGYEVARLVHDALTKRGYRVFLDVDSLRSGPFDKQLYDVIDSAQDFVLILSKNALDRCKNEGDWVREEIQKAIQSGKNIIPFIQRDFTWPAPMPDGMEELPTIQGIPSSMDYFDAVIDTLAGMLKAKPQNNRGKIIVAIVILIAVILAGLWCLKYFL